MTTKLQYQPRPFAPVTTTTAMILLKNMPMDVMIRIYEYDSTYKEIYKKKVIEQLGWYNLIHKNIKYSLINTSDFTFGLFDLYSEIEQKYISYMTKTVKFLTLFGFTADSFDINLIERPQNLQWWYELKNKWWFEDSRYRTYNRDIKERFLAGERGLKWKTMIWVQLKINTDKMNPELQATADKYRPDPNSAAALSLNPVVYIAANLLNSPDCNIQTTMNWNILTIQFSNVTIPLDPYLESVLNSRL